MIVTLQVPANTSPECDESFARVERPIKNPSPRCSSSGRVVSIRFDVRSLKTRLCLDKNIRVRSSRKDKSFNADGKIPLMRCRTAWFGKVNARPDQLELIAHHADVADCLLCLWPFFFRSTSLALTWSEVSTGLIIKTLIARSPDPDTRYIVIILNSYVCPENLIPRCLFKKNSYWQRSIVISHFHQKVAITTPLDASPDRATIISEPPPEVLGVAVLVRQQLTR